jgi:hypothetical protein
MQADDKYSGALETVLAPSARLACLCAAGGVATLGVIAATPLDLGPALALATWVACLAIDAIRRVRAPHRIAFDLAAVSVDGAAGTLRAGSFVAPWLTIVRWRPAGARFDRTLLVVPGRLPPDAFRHLRVILKHAPV